LPGLYRHRLQSHGGGRSVHQYEPLRARRRPSASARAPKPAPSAWSP